MLNTYDNEPGRMPLFSSARPNLQQADRKKSLDAKEKSYHAPPIRNTSSSSLNSKQEVTRAKTPGLGQVVQKNSLMKLDPQSPNKNVSLQNMDGGVLETISAKKRPKMPQLTQLTRAGNHTSSQKSFKTELFKNEAHSPLRVPLEKLTKEQKAKTLNPSVLAQKLESISVNSLSGKKNSIPSLRHHEVKDFHHHQPNFDSLPIRGKHISMENHHMSTKILPGLGSVSKPGSQEDDRKRSFLKAKFIDAKTQEAEVGLKLLPQPEQLSKKKSKLKEAIQKQNESNEMLQNQESEANTSFSKKFQSPVIYEMRKSKVRRNLPSDQDQKKKNSHLEETIKDDFDQSIFSSSNRGGIFDKSFSVVSSLSLSGSKESYEKHKSSSLDRNCSFILRNERHLGKSGRNSGNVRSSNGSDSSQPNNPSESQVIRDSLRVIRIENDVVEENKQAKPPAFQNLFNFNNNTIMHPWRKGSLDIIKPQIMVEDAAEDKNSASVKLNAKESVIKKENEKFGKIIEWKLGSKDPIGSGSFGKVYKAMEVDTGRIIAVKKIPVLNNEIGRDDKRRIDNELLNLQQCQHENIVQYLGHETLDSHLYIYMEYVAEGSIRSIYERFGPLQEKTIKVYLKQILAGLKYLHEKGVAHQDIKGANILIHKDGTVKLADFGCSAEIERTLGSGKLEKVTGTIPWMAPELWEDADGKKHNKRKSDIWSLGCTIVEMATGKTPWSQYNVENHFTLMLNISRTKDLPAFPETLSEELKDFISLCLKREPNERPQAAELLSHKFLAD